MDRDTSAMNVSDTISQDEWNSVDGDLVEDDDCYECESYEEFVAHLKKNRGLSSTKLDAASLAISSSEDNPNETTISVDMEHSDMSSESGSTVYQLLANTDSIPSNISDCKETFDELNSTAEDCSSHNNQLDEQDVNMSQTISQDEWNSEENLDGAEISVAMANTDSRSNCDHLNSAAKGCIHSKEQNMDLDESYFEVEDLNFANEVVVTTSPNVGRNEQLSSL